MCQLSGKDAWFTWTEQHNAAFEKLKIDLTRAPILIYPDFKQPFDIFIDASMRAIGAVLTQEKDGLNTQYHTQVAYLINMKLIGAYGTKKC